MKSKYITLLSAYNLETPEGKNVAVETLEVMEINTNIVNVFINNASLLDDDNIMVEMHYMARNEDGGTTLNILTPCLSTQVKENMNRIHKTLEELSKENDEEETELKTEIKL